MIHDERMSDSPVTVVDVLATRADDLRLLVESAAGYRAMIEAAGFTPQSAEILAANYLLLMQANAYEVKR